MQLMLISDGKTFKVVNPATMEKVEGLHAVEYSISKQRGAELKILIRGGCPAEIATEPDDEEPGPAAPANDPDAL